MAPKRDKKKKKEEQKKIEPDQNGNSKNLHKIIDEFSQKHNCLENEIINEKIQLFLSEDEDVEINFTNICICLFQFYQTTTDENGKVLGQLFKEIFETMLINDIELNNIFYKELIQMIINQLEKNKNQLAFIQEAINLICFIPNTETLNNYLIMIDLILDESTFPNQSINDLKAVLYVLSCINVEEFANNKEVINPKILDSCKTKLNRISKYLPAINQLEFSLEYFNFNDSSIVLLPIKDAIKQLASEYFSKSLIGSNESQEKLQKELKHFADRIYSIKNDEHMDEINFQHFYFVNYN